VVDKGAEGVLRFGYCGYLDLAIIA
jgi:hypothetical protein